MPGKARTEWQNKKALALARECNRCHYCSTRLDLDTVTLDHVVAKAFGGPNANWNLVASCAPCNEQFGDAIQKCDCPRCRRTVARFHREKRRSVDGAEVKWQRKHVSEDRVIGDLLRRIDKAQRRLAQMDDTELGAVALRGKIVGYREALALLGSNIVRSTIGQDVAS